MKYVKSFESHRKSKLTEPVNEELLPFVSGSPVAPPAPIVTVYAVLPVYVVEPETTPPAPPPPPEPVPPPPPPATIK